MLPIRDIPRSRLGRALDGIRTWTFRLPAQSLNQLRNPTPLTYELEHPSHWRIHDVFHVNLLKPFYWNGQPHPPSPFTYLAGQPYEYEVEAILDHRPRTVRVKHTDMPVVISPQLPNSIRRQLEFKVHWKWSSSLEDTWEPYSNLKHAPELLAA